MRIGIPNALFTSYHLPFWQEFFMQLGMDIVVSGDSCKETIDIGSKLIPHEFCIPVKVFLGHIVDLLSQKVDLILLPRMIDKKNHEFFCPKLTGLPEIVKYALNLDDSLFFSPEVICNGLNPQIVRYPQPKIKSMRTLRQAELKAEQNWQWTLERCRKEQSTLLQIARDLKNSSSADQIQVGLLGYAYILYDLWMSKATIQTLGSLDTHISTWEMVESEKIESRLKELKRPMFWNFGRILLGAGLNFLADPKIDGVIYVTPFGCGPDSITVKLLSLQAAITHKPFLQITLDEHSEDGHLKTRLEAFVDMLVQGKEGQSFENNFSLFRTGTRLSENV
ncbi:MAG TPA: hypothetical protein DDW50_11825 [Firmicutes bacterium]|jgi:predicted nucleotide-binding protein (sugar kinase/HSP70/actin superfamily)|nr:hypothetical protein [Bacillota bacterium]